MKTRYLLLIAVLFFGNVFSQKKLADKFFKNYSYIKAIELYEKVVEKGDSSVYVLTRLGDAYYNNSKSEKAAFWYGEALRQHKKVEAEYIYKYIQSLRSIGKYQEADKWFKTFRASKGSDSRSTGYNPDLADFFSILKDKNDVIITVENVDFNSEYSDFGGFVHKDKIYFASARNTDNKIYKWTNEPFLDIFVGDAKEDRASADNITILEFDEKQRTDIHKGTVCITNDGKTMYFTRDNVTKNNRKDYDKKGTSHLKIYKASLIGNVWSNIVELPFNDDKFSTGNPALSPDNKTLYFVSDREGGFGQTDIYAVAIHENGTFGQPKNLGETVNTEGREMFPFVGTDNTLYFSSDGYLNFGLLDIFKSNILKGEDGEPENLGKPYNSGYDDFAFFMESETQNGYFSSNRNGGNGNDDIYSFSVYQCKQTIIGTATDSKTGLPLLNVSVRLIDETGKIVGETTKGAKGEYEFIDVDCKTKYTVVGSKEDYKDDQKDIMTSDDNERVNTVDLSLTPLIIDNQIVINPIFFDFDKSTIRTDAQYELENIVDVMRIHPSMVIKIESHTDSRGSDKYNLRLSDRRAKATRDYIVSRGIDANRIESAIGYGETQLLNKCANKVKCSEEEHQLNRRSYFYILKD